MQSGLSITDIVSIDLLLVVNYCGAILMTALLRNKTSQITDLSARLAELMDMLSTDYSRIDKLASGVIRNAIFYILVGYAFYLLTA